MPRAVWELLYLLGRLTRALDFCMEKEWGLHVWSRWNLLEIMFFPIGVRLKDGMEWSIKDVQTERKYSLGYYS